jgi:LPXTG-site transpeptidase (sortase) family protein
MKQRLLLLALSTVLLASTSTAFASTQTTGVTRAGAVALLLNSDASDLARVRWYATHMPPMPLFKDVDQTQWYAPYVEVAFEQGLVTGNASATFRPGAALTQSEAITLMTRFKQIETPSAGVFLSLSPIKANPLVATASQAANLGIRVPANIDANAPVSKDDLFAMMQSTGVANPSQIQIAMIPVRMPLPLNVIDTTMVAMNDPAPAQPQPTHTTTLKPITQNTSTFHAPQYVAPIVYHAPQNPTPKPPSTFLAQVVPPAHATQTASIADEPYASTKPFAITMPSLGIKDLSINHPTDLSHDGLLVPLKVGVGHLFSYPGQGGTILIFGHSSSYPWDVSQYTKIFRQINKLQVGDKIYITYQKTLFVYQVTYKVTVPSNDMTAYAQQGHEELILYTCWPPDSIKQRYLVHASPVQVIALK